jgi:hypothetical protein
MGTQFIVIQERSAMAEQFENPEVTKLDNETVSEAAAQKRIARVAETEGTR